MCFALSKFKNRNNLYVLFNKLIKVAFVCFAALLVLSCGGGGGGGGGSVVAFNDTSGYHNGGDAGGWGNSGKGGNSSIGGINSDDDVEVTITGSAAVNVERYDYNGVSYSSVEEFKTVLLTQGGQGGTFYIDFYVEGETEPRKARVTTNGAMSSDYDILIEHQYMASVTLPDGTPMQIPFYRRDGLPLAPIAEELPDETVSPVTFPVIKVKVGGAEYDKNGTLPVPQTGDITLASVAPVYEKWRVSDSTPKTVCFSSSLNDGDRVAVKSTETIEEIKLPLSKMVSLDLSGAALPSVIDGDLFQSGNWQNLKEIKLPETGITEIGTSAFDACINLTKANIPLSVTIIADNAFLQCKSLEKISIPNGVTSIGQAAFQTCESLEEIVIPSSVTTLGNIAFKYCRNLASVTISDTIDVMGNDVFTDCSEDLIFYVANAAERRNLINRDQAISNPGSYGFANPSANAYAADKYKLAAHVKVKGAPAPAPGSGGFVLVEGATIKRQVADSRVFINGRTVEVMDTYVCDHEVTYDEYSNLMGGNPSFVFSPLSAGEVQSRCPTNQVNWYAVIAYCNKKSLQDGLQPCYSVNGMSETDWRNIIHNNVPIVDDVSWNSVTCDWTANGYRLPTEAEWEYAARGGNGLNGTQYTYAGSDNIDTVAWFGDDNDPPVGGNSGGKTHEVKKKNPNSLGLYDMSGNVYEWCWDWYSASITTTTPVSGTANNGIRSLRGGSYFRTEDCSAVSHLDSGLPTATYTSNGFRIVRNAQ